MTKKHHLSIWFLIGLQLVIMSVIIVAATIYSLCYPPANPVMFADLYPGFYEGAVMFVLGIFYSVKFRPSWKDG
jgi:FtsH-binding integral membrane protein